MANFVRRWTSDDIGKLKEMAGKQSREKIAAELGRGPSAIAVKAHQLRISLRWKGLSHHTAATTGLTRFRTVNSTLDLGSENAQVSREPSRFFGSVARSRISAHSAASLRSFSN